VTAEVTCAEASGGTASVGNGFANMSFNSFDVDTEPTLLAALAVLVTRKIHPVRVPVSVPTPINHFVKVVFCGFFIFLSSH
jgi:hypothetical protein